MKAVVPIARIAFVLFLFACTPANPCAGIEDRHEYANCLIAPIGQR